MAEEHRRRTDQNGATLHERRTDSDLVARAGAFMDRYKVWWVIVVAITSWWTRTVMVPLRESALTTQEVREINVKIDSVIVPRLDSADADRRAMIHVQTQQGRILGYLSRTECLRTSAIDRVRAEIDCKDIPIIAAPPPLQP